MHVVLLNPNMFSIMEETVLFINQICTATYFTKSDSGSRTIFHQPFLEAWMVLPLGGCQKPFRVGCESVLQLIASGMPLTPSMLWYFRCQFSWKSGPSYGWRAFGNSSFLGRMHGWLLPLLFLKEKNKQSMRGIFQASKLTSSCLEEVVGREEFNWILMKINVGFIYQKGRG